MLIQLRYKESLSLFFYGQRRPIEGLTYGLACSLVANDKCERFGWLICIVIAQRKLCGTEKCAEGDALQRHLSRFNVYFSFRTRGQHSLLTVNCVWVTRVLCRVREFGG